MAFLRGGGGLGARESALSADVTAAFALPLCVVFMQMPGSCVLCSTQIWFVPFYAAILANASIAKVHFT